VLGMLKNRNERNFCIIGLAKTLSIIILMITSICILLLRVFDQDVPIALVLAFGISTVLSLFTYSFCIIKKIKQDPYKKVWFKNNSKKIFAVALFDGVLFAMYFISHNIIYDVLAIVLGFSSIIYFRNKWKIYLENDKYSEE